MPVPPSYRKVNPADQPVLLPRAHLATCFRISQVNEYAETLIAQRMSTVKGVAQVLVYGSQKYAVRVQVDPYALAARGIGIDEVRAGHRAQQRQPAHRHAERAEQGRLDRIHRAARQRRGLPRRSSSPIATARRCA